MPDHPREADRVPLPEPPNFPAPDAETRALVNAYCRAYADACVAAAVAQERERWQSELSVIHRTLVLETQAHKRSHEEALRLAERLRKYEPGKPMHLNAIRKDPQ